MRNRRHTVTQEKWWRFLFNLIVTSESATHPMRNTCEKAGFWNQPDLHRLRIRTPSCRGLQAAALFTPNPATLTFCGCYDASPWQPQWFWLTCESNERQSMVKENPFTDGVEMIMVILCDELNLYDNLLLTSAMTQNNPPQVFNQPFIIFVSVSLLPWNSKQWIDCGRQGVSSSRARKSIQLHPWLHQLRKPVPLVFLTPFLRQRS